MTILGRSGRGVSTGRREGFDMPKMITGTGKIMRTKGMKSHFRRRKSPRTRRMFDKMYEVAKADRARIRQLLPYGVK